MVAVDKELEAKAITKALEKIAQRQQLNINKALSMLLDSSDGREFLWWLLSEAGVGRNPFSPDALKMAFICGELNTGQKLQARILEVDQAGYFRMLEDQLNYDRERAIATVRATAGDADDSAGGEQGAFADW